MDKMEFYQNYLTVYEIGEDEKSLLPIEYGIEKVDPNFTEEKDEKSYWSDKGGSTVTTQGIKIDFAFSGDRAYGAPDQEYIRSKLLDANDRKCYFKVTEADGKILEGLATIIDVKPFGGDANAKAEFSFGVSFSGMPKETIPEKKITYYVEFLPNKGTGIMPIQTIEEDEEVELSANTFVRNSYEFVGWALTVSRHVAFEDRQIVKNLTEEDAETISLYAVWEK